MQITWDLKQQRRLRMCFVMLFPASLTCCVQKHSKSPNSRPFPWLSRPNSPKWMDTARFETRIEATSWLKHSFFLRAVTEENWQQLQENQNKKKCVQNVQIQALLLSQVYISSPSQTLQSFEDFKDKCPFSGFSDDHCGSPLVHEAKWHLSINGTQNNPN